MKENHILYKFFLLAMMGVIPMIGWADDVFKHYQGIANKEGDYEIINASADVCVRRPMSIIIMYQCNLIVR